MSTSEPGAPVPIPDKRPSPFRRAWNFLLELIDVLMRPSSVFGRCFASPRGCHPLPKRRGCTVIASSSLISP
jgi:hypothetical protein